MLFDKLINLYISFYDHIYDHHPIVKQTIIDLSSKKYFDINYELILIDKLSIYNSIPMTKIMLINDISSFIDLLLYVFKKSTIRIVDPILLNINYSKIGTIIIEQNYDNIVEDVVIIINPSYNSGTLYKNRYIQKIIEANPNTIFIIDESYIDYLLLNNLFYYSSKSLLYFNNLFIIRSFKIFNVYNEINYILSNQDNIKILSKYYKYNHIIDISKVYIIEIFNNIEYYKKNILSVSDNVNKLIDVLIKNSIIYSINANNFITISTLDVNRIFNIFYRNNITIYNTYKIRPISHIKVSLCFN